MSERERSWSVNLEVGKDGGTEEKEKDPPLLLCIPTTLVGTMQQLAWSRCGCIQEENKAGQKEVDEHMIEFEHLSATPMFAHPHPIPTSETPRVIASIHLG